MYEFLVRQNPLAHADHLPTKIRAFAIRPFLASRVLLGCSGDDRGGNGGRWIGYLQLLDRRRRAGDREPILTNRDLRRHSGTEKSEWALKIGPTPI